MIPERAVEPSSPELQEIWDRVPAMKDCKGLCHTSCGPIGASSIEHEQIEARGKSVGINNEGRNGQMTCSLLTPDGRCSVYEVRPLLCRIWGAARALPCPYGCVPERYISDLEAFELLEEVRKLAGDSIDYSQDRMLRDLGPQLAEVWEEEIGKPARAAARAGGQVEWREATD